MQVGTRISIFKSQEVNTKSKNNVVENDIIDEKNDEKVYDEEKVNKDCRQ